MVKLARSSASLYMLVFALVVFSASPDVFAEGPRWDGLDREPMSSTAALADFKEMIEERCRKGWFAPPLTHEACPQNGAGSCIAKTASLSASGQKLESGSFTGKGRRCRSTELQGCGSSLRS